MSKSFLKWQEWDNERAAARQEANEGEEANKRRAGAANMAVGAME
jgi:hypothetical protein